MTVIDASVYVTLVNAQERNHAACWAWLQAERARKQPISAPVILLTEVSAALSRGMDDTALAHCIVQQLAHAGIVELVPVTFLLAQRAAVIAADHRIPGCDAIYVALAEHLDVDLVTLGRQQLERASDVVTTRRP